MRDTMIIAPVMSGSSDETTKTRLIAAGGILGAIAASTCCVIPLVLFSLGISGAWIGNLTALSPYKPIFIAITLGFLGYGYYLVYRRPKITCDEDKACARPLPGRIVKISLYFSTLLVLIAFVWPVIIPIIAPYVFG